VKGCRVTDIWHHRTEWSTLLPTVNTSVVLVIKANEVHNFSYLFDKVLYMFRTGPLSIIRSISTPNSYILLRVYSVQWKTPDDGHWTCPKHVRYFIKYIRENVHLIGFYYKNISRCTVLWMPNFRSFKVVRSLHFLYQCIPFITPTTCTFLISTKHHMSFSNMFRHACTIFREKTMLTQLLPRSCCL
jgi:hypothetical protein